MPTGYLIVFGEHRTCILGACVPQISFREADFQRNKEMADFTCRRCDFSGAMMANMKIEMGEARGVYTRARAACAPTTLNTSSPHPRAVSRLQL